MGRHIRADETGATTVDWVVLTASAGAMALSMMALLSDGSQSLGGRVQDRLAGVEVARIALASPAPSDPPPLPVAEEVGDVCGDCPIVVLPADDL